MKIHFISLNCGFQKDYQTRKFHMHFESKIKMMIDSPFRFDSIVALKKLKRDSLLFAVEEKVNENWKFFLFHMLQKKSCSNK